MGGIHIKENQLLPVIVKEVIFQLNKNVLAVSHPVKPVPLRQNAMIVIIEIQDYI